MFYRISSNIIWIQSPLLDSQCVLQCCFVYDTEQSGFTSLHHWGSSAGFVGLSVGGPKDNNNTYKDLISKKVLT